MGGRGVEAIANNDVRTAGATKRVRHPSVNQSSDGTISPARSRRESACSARERTSLTGSSASGGSEGGSG